MSHQYQTRFLLFAEVKNFVNEVVGCSGRNSQIDLLHLGDAPSNS